MKVEIVGNEWFMHKLIHNLEDMRMDNKMHNRILILDRLLDRQAITTEEYVSELNKIYSR